MASLSLPNDNWPFYIKCQVDRVPTEYYFIILKEKAPVGSLFTFPLFCLPICAASRINTVSLKRARLAGL